MAPLSLRPFRYVIGFAFASALVVAIASTGQATTVSHAGSDAPVGNVPAQAAPCFVDRQTTTTAAPADVSGGIQVRLSVVVSETTRVRVDNNGSVVAIGTNSGCAPKAGDNFIIEADDERFTVASPSVVSSALACRVAGSWEDTTQWHNCRF